MPEDNHTSQTLLAAWNPAELSRETLTQDPCTDLGNSERAARQLEGELLYAPTDGYFRWAETHWERCPDEGVYNLLGHLFRADRSTLRRVQDEGDVGLCKWLKKSEDLSRLKAASSLLRGNPRVTTEMSEFDSHPYLVNFSNGTVDIRDGILRQHSPADRITHVLPYCYEPAARSLRIAEFIQTITGGDTELASFLQRAVGYTLCARPTEEVLFFLYGTGANGKTTFLEAIKAAVGSYAKKAPPTLLHKGKGNGPSPERADLKGCRMAVGSELDESTPLSESTIKDIVSNDTITARGLYQGFFEFLPTHVLWIMGNHRPRISGCDDGIWRRILLVPFTVTIPVAERDGGLLDELKRSHLPGIMNWIIEGARNYLAHGITPPATVVAASAEYRLEMDVVQRFLEACCNRRADARVSVKDLYSCYRHWATIGGELPLGKPRFGRRLQELDFSQGRSANERFWNGIEFNHESADLPACV